MAAQMARAVRKPRGLSAWIAGMSPIDRYRIADDELRGKIADNIQMALKQGSRGVAVDMQVLFARSWCFDPADIAVPVDIWHGRRGRQPSNRRWSTPRPLISNSRLEVVQTLVICSSSIVPTISWARCIAPPLREIDEQSRDLVQMVSPVRVVVGLMTVHGER
ncbi:hypothetical protein [Nocardia nepalensis]|uniref:hypothetical protein n=1 Tax=Nocardia nepalensis TaxID=3375448 RepID=UPI003B6842A4